MKTISTVDGYERTASGAHKITFLGDKVAGTFDDEIGALAQRLATEGAEANPVEVVFEQQDGKVFVKSMDEITPPPELGGEEVPPAAPEDATQAAAEETATAAEPQAEAKGVMEQADDDQVAAALPSSVLVAEIGERLARLDGLDK